MQRLTDVIDDLLELCLTEAIRVLRRVNDLIQASSSAQLHDDHLVVVLPLCVGGCQP